MNEAQVLALINQYIKANGNNEITGTVLNNVLISILEQVNDKIGELSTLSTAEQSSVVGAINEVLNGLNVFSIHSGTDDPNVTQPSSYSIGDWYIRGGSSIYQYNGIEWVLLSNSTQGSVIKTDSFIYTSPDNVFETTEIINKILDVQIGQGCNFDDYATINNGNEVTIDNNIIFGGERIKIIYTI